MKQSLLALSSYLPYPLAARLLEQPGRPLLGESERFDAVVLFADIAGFTPLTEAMGRSGPQGTEALTDILNGLFTALIEQVHRWGGIVGKFGGDAMTVLFCGENYLLRALSCALALRRVVAEQAYVETAAGSFLLQVRQGLAAGPVLQTVVGTTERADVVFAGPPLLQSAEAESHASPGETILHPSLAGLLPATSLQSTPLPDGYLRLDRLMVEVPPRPHPPLPAFPDPEQAARALRPFLPPHIYERLLGGGAAFVNEHRHSTVLFVGFEGIDYLAPDAAERLERYVTRALETVARFEGLTCRIDVGDKGSRVMVLFGAPITHENDEERALLCALALRPLGDDLGLSQRIGVNSGRVFVGHVGSPHRQEYTAMGDGVNLAARLMQAARPGQILVGAETCAAAGEEFTWRALPPLRLKGKARPVQAYDLVECLTCSTLYLQEPRYDLPMVGRREELAHLEGLLARVLETGQGQVVGITAEAGMGKSRLGAEVIRRALTAGFVGLGGSGVSHGGTVPYLAWRPLLRGLLDLEERGPVEAQVQTLQQRLEQFYPDLLPRLPLLGDLLGLPIPDNPTTAAFDADLRRRSLFALVVDLIRGRAAGTPLLLVMEDAHWLDDLSRDLARQVAREIAPWPIFFLTLYRPPEVPLWDGTLAHRTEIALGPFAPEESAALLHLKLAGRDLPPGLVEQIEERAQGNPFFVDEFISLLLEQGIDLDDAAALSQVEVPDSLQALIVSRLDRLSESEKMTIRVASVIGRLFPLGWLRAIYPGDLKNGQLERDLERLNRLGLVPLDRVDPEPTYLFRHTLTREVAYNTLAFATRRMLHRRVAVHIEKTHAGELGPWYGILVHHYRQAGDAEKEFAYLEPAARQAARQGGLRQAVALYSRALELLPQVFSDPGQAEERRYALLLGREAAWGMLGERAEQLADLETLTRLAQPGAEERHRAEVSLRYAAYYEAVSDFAAALEAAQKVVHLAVRSGDPAGHVDGLVAGARALWRQGRFEEARRYLDGALGIARKNQDRRREAAGLHHLGTILYLLGDYESAQEILEQALLVRRELQDRQGEAASLSNLAGIFFASGDFGQARTLSEQALLLYQAIGDRRLETQVLSNLGSLDYALGEFERACRHHQEAMVRSRKVEDRANQALAAGNLGLALRALGDHETARDYCEQALAIYRAIGSRQGEGDSLTYLAFALESLGDLEAAIRAYREALHLRHEIGQEALAIDDLAGLARVALRQGQVETALAHIQEAIAWIEQNGIAGVDYPLWLYLTAAAVFAAAGQPEQAHSSLEQAYTMLLERAGRIADPAARQAFLQKVPLHRQILEQWAQQAGSRPPKREQTGAPA